VCSLDAGDADGAAEAVAQPAATREHRIAIPQSPRPPTASSPFCTSQSHRPHHQPLACRRKYAIERGTLSLLNCCGRGPAQRLATGSTVRASNPSRGRDFPHPFRPVLGPTVGTGFYPGGKTTGVWRWPPTTTTKVEFEETVELYRFFPSVLSWQVIGRTSITF